MDQSQVLTDEQKQALMHVLDLLWHYGADRHPEPARALNKLRTALDMKTVEYQS